MTKLGVWQGQGVVRIDGTEVRDGKTFAKVIVLATGTLIGVPVENVDKAVRPLVARDEAERLLQALPGAPDLRPWRERYHDAMVALVRRPLADQLSVLHAFYRAPFKLSFGERKVVDQLERVAVGEIAHVLGRPIDELVGELHAGRIAFAAGAPARPADPPIVVPVPPIEVADHEYLGALTAESGYLVVGEPEIDPFLAAGAAGEWHAFVGEDGLVAIHADALARYPSVTLELIASINVEGGTVAVASAEVVGDDAFVEALMFPVDPIVWGRGCIVRTHGDGEHRVRGHRSGDRLTVIAVDF